MLKPHKNFASAATISHSGHQAEKNFFRLYFSYPYHQSQKKFFFGQTSIYIFYPAARKPKSEEVFFGRVARMADSGSGMKVFTSFWSLLAQFAYTFTYLLHQWFNQYFEQHKVFHLLFDILSEHI